VRSNSKTLFQEPARLQEREAKKYKAKFRVVFQYVDYYANEQRVDMVELERWTYQGEEDVTMRQMVVDGIMIDNNTRLIPGSHIQTIYLIGKVRGRKSLALV